MAVNQEMKDRVARKIYRHKDISVTGLLTEDDIRNIPESTVFQWVCTKQWDYKDFKKWLGVKQGMELI